MAAGSNPVSPTIKKSLEFQSFRGFFFLTEIHNIPPNYPCFSLTVVETVMETFAEFMGIHNEYIFIFCIKVFFLWLPISHYYHFSMLFMKGLCSREDMVFIQDGSKKDAPIRKMHLDFYFDYRCRGLLTSIVQYFFCFGKTSFCQF